METEERTNERDLVELVREVQYMLRRGCRASTISGATQELQRCQDVCRSSFDVATC